MSDLKSGEKVSELTRAVAGIHTWLKTMRNAEGYAGPVVHWWRNCFLYAGAGFDWRYEGIISGYLQLYEKSRNRYWLDRAVTAADDAVHSQLSTHTYRCSRFELNPYTGGTPHEAAVDIGLLRLAQVLMGGPHIPYDLYLNAAARNLGRYYAECLCHPESGAIFDNPDHSSFVPNKAATGAEAFILLEQVTGDPVWVEKHALPSLDLVLKHQVLSGRDEGAIHQLSVRGRPDGRFFPFYIARCASGLLAGYQLTGRRDYLDAAWRAMDFIVRHLRVDGSFPQVVYANGQVNEYPKWIAATGDILRVMRAMNAMGGSVDEEPTRTWLWNGLDPSGAVRTASGFAEQVSQRQAKSIPDLRDVLGVVGWADKAFRYFAACLSESEASQLSTDGGSEGECSTTSVDCVFAGKRFHYCEDKHMIKLEQRGELAYQWVKGEPWAEVSTPGLFGA